MGNNPPAVDVVALRAEVRRVISAMPPAMKVTKAVLLAGLKAQGFAPGDMHLDEAIEWNLSRGYIDYRYDTDIDQDVWFLTPRGLAKEGLA